MRTIRVTNLLEPFQTFYRYGRWDQYAQALDKWGPEWLLELRLQRLALHVHPLCHVDSGFEWTPRLRFLVEVVRASTPVEELIQYCREFCSAGDHIAAAGALEGAVMLVMNTGNSLRDLQKLDDLIEEVMGTAGNQACAMTSFCISRSFTKIVGSGDFDSSLYFGRLARGHAFKTGSVSLSIRAAWAAGFALTYTGDFPALRIIVDDIQPLLEAKEASSNAVLQMQTLTGLYHYFEGRGEKAEVIFRNVLDHPHALELPPYAWLMASGSLLMTISELGRTSEAEKLSEQIRLRAIPEKNYLFWSCVHYCHGVYELMRQKAYEAYLHGMEGMEYGRLSGSPLPELQNALVVAQSLVDLKRTDEAGSFLNDWINTWCATGFRYFAACGAMEMARALLDQGRLDRAGEYYERAIHFTPMGSELNVVNRPAGFVESLRQEIQARQEECHLWKDQENAVIRIQTFGGFEMFAGDRLVFDQKRKGIRSQLLLKALIVHGGVRVSRDLLLDLLWPDTDGDMAVNNLKVMISRLRKAMNQALGRQFPWLVVEQGCITLDNAFCTVDCLRFREQMRAARKRDCSIEKMKEILDVYTGDFLPEHVADPWVERYRCRLREEYVQGALLMSRMCLQLNRSEEALYYLQKARALSVANEQVFAMLMHVFIDMGFPSEALRTFQQARVVLKKEVDTLPGPILLSLARQAHEVS
ncbi:AfsR/SARP family transcriptional regulator [Desulfonatronum lacustre]|uniref:AfsR/SARP family transcriptional regulator n=1 Tax=Desulfonatronum lacustre TaxID=66849 RepID=UPI00048E4D6C|nr:bacterial transcriptional activator domain-containing protein [Desulfonatronum lacustre]